MNNKISPKQQRILQFISEFSIEHGYPPSVREICAEMDLRSPSTVHAHLKKLQEAGYLESNDHKSRALTPVSGPGMVPRVPIIGRVTAGIPILAVEEHVGYVPFEGAAAGGEYYALRIRGDSMIGVGIMDGDLVIVRQDAAARSGDIVIALLEDEATCKTLSVTADGVWLLPENPAYTPINGNGCQILGVVKAVYREY
ncbi:transcriptional repressor LexA [Agathobaculum sp.]|uniref:transcriptional repressor LexA n=1 Tax=Agathobaculum sp. TaxID=2048138 RepID=UPI002A83BE1B|nr:transcriptional repressor LexA [Agathobaculum sp.]MDY3619281.1 transcriptional repressor LexA [Agathobaculum sp.]